MLRLIISSLILFSCQFNDDKPSNVSEEDWNYRMKTIEQIDAPAGYERIFAIEHSFGDFLRNLSLKKENIVYYYNGEKKGNQNQYAVIDLPVEGEFEQCADFVMKLRMYYLKSENKDLLFYDNEGGSYKLSPPYAEFKKYMQTVFGMCGTMSLSKSMQKKKIKDIQIGDVFIKGGFPGHVQIVVDVVTNLQTGHKYFMLAEGYTPAQSPHIVMNLETNGPWFDANEETVNTSGYLFSSENLMTW